MGDFNPSLRITKVTFRVPTFIRSELTTSIIVPGDDLVTNVGDDGTFTLPVYGTNDPNWSPDSWDYKVIVDGDDLHEEFYTQVPYNAGTIRFPSLIPSLTSSLGSLYALYNHGNHVLVLGPSDPVPPGTPAGTIIYRTT